MHWPPPYWPPPPPGWEVVQCIHVPRGADILTSGIVPCWERFAERDGEIYLDVMYPTGWQSVDWWGLSTEDAKAQFRAMGGSTEPPPDREWQYDARLDEPDTQLEDK